MARSRDKLEKKVMSQQISLFVLVTIWGVLFIFFWFFIALGMLQQLSSVING